MHTLKSLRVAFPIVCSALLVLGCAESSSDPLDPQHSLIGIQGTAGAADIGEFELCAVGSQAIFRAIVDGLGQTPARFRLGPDACVVIATSAQLGVGNHIVTIIEDVMNVQGQVLDSIVSTSVFVGGSPVRGAPLTGTPMVTQTFNGDRGWLVQFYNH